MRSMKAFLLMLSIVFFLVGSAVGRRIDRRIRSEYPRTPNPVTKETRKVEMDLGYDFTVTGRTDRMKLLVLLPRSISGRQKIESVSCNPPASRIINKNGNRYAQFQFFKPKKRFSVNIKVHAELYRYDLDTARKKKGKYHVEEPDLGEFLIDERLIQKDDESIRAMAKKINGRSRLETVKKVYEYVIDTLEFGGLFEDEFGAVQALSQKKGDCTEYSDLFVALCRAKGIPARVVTGYTIRFDSVPPKHHWTEVYFENLGWV
ncbi:MAG: transglutaminase-like domain-containing protein, partial [Planctomycetota bacterium]